MLISGATLALGILAVFAAILYRIVAEDASAGRAPPVGVAASLSAAALGLPAGAALVSTAVDGNRLVLTYSHPGGHTLLFIDVTRMAVTGRLELADK